MDKVNVFFHVHDPGWGKEREIVIMKGVNYLSLILLYNMDIGEHTLIHVFSFQCFHVIREKKIFFKKY